MLRPPATRPHVNRFPQGKTGLVATSGAVPPIETRPADVRQPGVRSARMSRKRLLSTGFLPLCLCIIERRGGVAPTLPAEHGRPAAPGGRRRGTLTRRREGPRFAATVRSSWRQAGNLPGKDRKLPTCRHESAGSSRLRLPPGGGRVINVDTFAGRSGPPRNSRGQRRAERGNGPSGRAGSRPAPHAPVRRGGEAGRPGFESGHAHP